MQSMPRFCVPGTNLRQCVECCPNWQSPSKNGVGNQTGHLPEAVRDPFIGARKGQSSLGDVTRFEG
jgi:hypothetical protein